MDKSIKFAKIEQMANPQDEILAELREIEAKKEARLEAARNNSHGHAH